MNLFMKMRRSRRAVSPIIATLLLIVISIAGAVAIYGWMSSVTSSTVGQQPLPLGSLQFEGATLWNKSYNETGNSGQVTFTVRNTGTGDLTLESLYYLDPNGAILNITSVTTRPESAGGNAPGENYFLALSSSPPRTTTRTSGGNTLSALSVAYVTADFGKPGGDADGFRGGTLYNFKLVCTNGYSLEFSARKGG